MGDPVLFQIGAVSLGAALGALLRWQAGVRMGAVAAGFPLGTLAVNCVGGLAIGVAYAWLEQRPHEMWRLFAVTGFLGGLTTFSAFSGESLLLLQRREWALALAHSAAHVVGALACTALGFALMNSLLDSLVRDG